MKTLLLLLALLLLATPVWSAEIWLTKPGDPPLGKVSVIDAREATSTSGQFGAFRDWLTGDAHVLIYNDASIPQGACDDDFKCKAQVNRVCKQLYGTEAKEGRVLQKGEVCQGECMEGTGVDVYCVKEPPPGPVT